MEVAQSADGAKDTASEKKPVKPKHFKKKAQEKIAASYEDIVAKLAERATEGSVRHTELLFDLGQVKEEVKASRTRRKQEPSLGKILLQEAEKLKREKKSTPSA